MESTILVDSFIKKIAPVRILNIITILALPMWLLYKFFPDLFNDINSYIYINNLPQWFPSIIILTVRLLVALSLISLVIIAILKVTELIQYILRIIFGYLDSTVDEHRELLVKFLFRFYIRLMLYIMALVLYSQMIFNNAIPSMYIHTTYAYWIILCPFKLFFILIIISLIIP